ncbi:MAG: GTP pyrophosphokinase [Saprospiraceae bacterium]|jgi:GTP pyrophosphokinase
MSYFETSDTESALLRAVSFVREIGVRAELEEEQLIRNCTKCEKLAALCQEIGIDELGQVAAILQVAEPLSEKVRARITKQFGAEVAELVRGVAQMANISAFSKSKQGEVSNENLRKMLIAMVNDVRVVLIKLADQLDNLRSLKDADENYRREQAQLTLDVYARLANRLGVWYLKWELEDYSLRYLEPYDYHQIASNLDEKRDVRERYITDFTTSIEQELTEINVEGSVYGRPKHIYSIWRKMKFKGLAFENIMDIRAVRILVNSVSDCYAALGVVHSNWSHLPGDFDDYIATPKENGYQSIHTAVIGPSDKVVEVQIRTHDMHEENELGVAAHWRYKEGAGSNKTIDNKIQWLRQLLEWKEDLFFDGDIAEQFDTELVDEQVYVFTPKGKVIDLPLGATAIDFAYAVHTQVGHSTRGTRINGRMRTLTTPLQTGDQVDIVTVKDATPSRDWLALPGYVKSHRARSAIAHWFKQADREQHVAMGRDILERELPRQGLSQLSYDKIAQRSNYPGTEEMMAALGAGDIKIVKLIGAFKREKEVEEPKLPVFDAARYTKSPSPSDFTVHGVGNLKTQIANCCQPVPGEPIVGFITRGRGISIHNKRCSNILHLQDDDHARLIDVNWGSGAQTSYIANINITAYNRSGLLHDVTKMLNDAKIQIQKAALDIQEEDSIVQLSLAIEVVGIATLTSALARVKQIPNVLEAVRAAK